MCFFLWFAHPVSCSCYPCDPLAWPFNSQLFRLHPLCCLAAVPSAALYLSFSFQHVKTSSCFIPLLTHVLQSSASPHVHFSCQHDGQLPRMFFSPTFGGFVHLSELLKLVKLYLLKTGHSTRHQKPVLLPVGAFPGFLISTSRSSPGIPKECQGFPDGRRKRELFGSSPWPPACLSSTCVGQRNVNRARTGRGVMCNWSTSKPALQQYASRHQRSLVA